MAPMDDGYKPDIGCDVFDPIARLRAWMRENGVSWSSASLASGVTEDEIRRLIQQGTDRLPENLHVIHRLASGLKIDLDWLLTGNASPDSTESKNVRLKQWQLVEQYITRSRLSRKVAQRFLQWYMRRVDNRLSTSQLGVFEKGLPRTQQDVHRWYAQFSKRN